MTLCKKLYAYIIIIFFVPIVTLLLYMSLTGTVYITLMEQAYFLKDNILKNIAMLILLCGFLVFIGTRKSFEELKKRINHDKKLYCRIRFGLLAFLFVVTMIWVWVSKISPFADAGILHDLSQAYINGIYDDFAGGQFSYIDQYPFQVRTLIWFVLIDRIFGGYRLMVYQTLNCVFIVMAFASLSDISLSMDMSPFSSLAVIVSGILWLPVVFYSSFIYGNIPGLGLALLSLAFWIRYYRSGKAWELIVSVISFGVAYCMKSIFLINLAAMLIYAFFVSVQKKSFKRLFVSTPLLAVIMVCMSVIPYRFFVHTTGKPLDQGMTTLSCIELGLSETTAAPGWYTDDSKLVYCELGYQKDAHQKAVIERIGNRLGEFRDNPGSFGDFELRKIASQWNEPSCQSLWFMRSSEGNPPEFVKKLMDYPGYVKMMPIFNIMHLWLTFGCFLCIMFYRESESSYEKLIFPLIFVGAFVFHLVWEAKAQYAFLYWVMMLPCAISGFGQLPGWIKGLIDKERAASDRTIVLKVSLVAVAIVFIVVINVCGLTSGLVRDNAAFNDYLLNNFK